ncbi:MAG: hypothetical protein ACOCZL_03425 [Bacteroidota bacterium]
MNALTLIYLIGLTLLITLAFTHLFRVRGPWGTFWTFFLVILLAVIAADIWVQPIGPYYRDVYWLPPLVVGILFALILAAASPGKKERKRVDQAGAEYHGDKVAFIALGVFFWFLLILLFVLVVTRLVFAV